LSARRIFLKVGRWAIEVANEYPETRVIGMDLSPIQPSAIPENCDFIVGDLREDLAQFDGSIALVHSRYAFHGQLLIESYNRES
jgi:hypothetical protein